MYGVGKKERNARWVVWAKVTHQQGNENDACYPDFVEKDMITCRPHSPIAGHSNGSEDDISVITTVSNNINLVGLIQKLCEF